MEKDLRFQSEGKTRDTEVLSSLITDLQRSSRYHFDGSRTLAYPVEPASPFIARAAMLQLTQLNHNLNSTFYTEGHYRRLHEDGRKLAQELLHFPNTERDHFALLTLPSATFSLRQALGVGLQKRYREVTGRNFQKDGAVRMRQEGFQPVILAPVAAKFLLDHIQEEHFNLGSDLVKYYDLDGNYQPDPESLDKALLATQNEGKIPVASLLFGGDATRGIMHRNVNEITETFLRHGRKPLTIVDASSQWLVGAATDKGSSYDFSNPEVDMMIADPQKVGFPYGTSFLFIRNGYDFGAFDDQQAVQFDPAIDPARRSLMLSRGFTGDFSVLAYLALEGVDGLRQRGRHDYDLACHARDALRSSALLDLYPCDGRMIVYGVKPGSGVTNWELAQALNNQQTPYGRVTVGYDPSIRARTTKEIAESEHMSKYDGLFGTVTNMHTSQNMRRLFSTVEDVVRYLRDEKIIFQQ